MTAYTLAVNSVFVFLIVGGFWLSGKGVTAALLLDLLFYIIITPVISLTLSKLMLMSENTMLVTDALKRMDAVLTAPALSRPEQPQSPKDSAVTFDHVTFSYDGTKNALEDISLTIGAGETAALVGPSGGGKSTLASLAARFFDPTSGRRVHRRGEREGHGPRPADEHRVLCAAKQPSHQGQHPGQRAPGPPRRQRDPGDGRPGAGPVHGHH